MPIAFIPFGQLYRQQQQQRAEASRDLIKVTGKIRFFDMRQFRGKKGKRLYETNYAVYFSRVNSGSSKRLVSMQTNSKTLFFWLERKRNSNLKVVMQENTFLDEKKIDFRENGGKRFFSHPKSLVVLFSRIFWLLSVFRLEPITPISVCLSVSLSVRTRVHESIFRPPSLLTSIILTRS